MHNAIIQSGSVLTQSLIMPRNDSIKYAFLFGEAMNCRMDTNKNLRNCLLNKTADDIVKGQLTFSAIDPSYTPFRPSIEENRPDAFLGQNPIELINSNDLADIPIMIGLVRNEG
ncbi:hypothetical protein RI129_005360 [Pyrocoelia pectoralis]|uniref:Carboxylesterase type B domain-containing protein n=1 Tax=Pyrocoelia pectoralis TaxID=417401 RepID=A0AAN7ZS92_9COLE